MPIIYNKVMLAGNVAQDPETRYTQSGRAVTKFALAVNNPQNKEASFVDIIAWEKLGETCQTYLKKGSGALVEGRLSIRSFEDTNGTRRKALEIVINDMQMLGERRYGKASAATAAGRAKSSSSRKAEDSDGPAEADRLF